MELPCDPAILLLSIYQKKKFKKTRASVFTAALFTKAKTWKQRKCPLTEEWVKMCHTDTGEYYPAIKRMK